MSASQPLRVMVHETWDEVAMAVAPTTTVRDVKARALAEARVIAPAAEFQIKFRGAEVADESMTLAELAVPVDAAMIVLRRRRRPVR